VPRLGGQAREDDVQFAALQRTQQRVQRGFDHGHHQLGHVAAHPGQHVLEQCRDGHRQRAQANAAVRARGDQLRLDQ